MLAPAATTGTAAAAGAAITSAATAPAVGGATVAAAAQAQVPVQVQMPAHPGAGTSRGTPPPARPAVVSTAAHCASLMQRMLTRLSACVRVCMYVPQLARRSTSACARWHRSPGLSSPPPARTTTAQARGCS
eukprot:scaffold589_cov343-Prasinococcus_capsulatus_cf.AAC.8